MYTAFASVYDRLMADVDYLAWARFYHELMERYGEDLWLFEADSKELADVDLKEDIKRV